jgi:hypothetical protein
MRRQPAKGGIGVLFSPKPVQLHSLLDGAANVADALDRHEDVKIRNCLVHYPCPD